MEPNFFKIQVASKSTYGKNLKNSFRLALLLAPAMQVLYFAVKIPTSGLIAHYPFMASDSFDYVVEGEYLRTILFGDATDATLPVLRQPGLVSLAMLDSLLSNSSGKLLLILLALANAVFFLSLAKICSNYLGRPSLWLSSLLALTAVLPIASFRLFILPGIFAMSLGTLSLAIGTSRETYRRSKSVISLLLFLLFFLCSSFRLDSSLFFIIV